MTWLGGENFQLGFNTGLLDTKFIELGQAGEGTVPAYDEGDGFAGRARHDGQPLGPIRLAAREWAEHFGAPRLHVDGRLHDVCGRTAAAHAGSLRLAERSARVRHRPNWSVLLAGTNLTDEYYSPAFFYTVSQQLWDGSVGRPREVYFGLNFSFD